MIAPFRLHRPTTVDEAAGLAGALDDAAFYRGGTELLQVMKLGLARFDHLIDLKQIPELSEIQTGEDGSLRIGGTVTHRQLERSSVVTDRHPALAALERHVANRRVREMGSLGGNLCFAEPHSDPATYLAACDASVELVGQAGRRTVAVDAFIQGALMTDRADDEVLVSINVPPLAVRSAVAYHKITLAERPTVAAACLIRLEDDGRVGSARVVLGSAGERPQSIEASARLLEGVSSDLIDRAALEAGSVAGREADVVDDPVASIDYRRHLVSVLARRAITEAYREAQHHGA